MLTLTVTITAVVGYSSGAPDFACSSMTPAHPSNTASGPVPFNVNISSLDCGYRPGQTYTSYHKIIAIHSLVFVIH